MDFNYTNTYNNIEQFDEQLLKAICNLDEIKIAFTKFNWVWYDKWMWNIYAWNEYDKTSIGKRIAEMVVNKALCEPIKIITPNEELNKIIKSHLESDFHFNSVFAQNLVSGMIDGDLLLSLQRDIYTGKPVIHFVKGINMIPLEYNCNGEIHKVAYFEKEMLEDEKGRVQTFIKMTIEDDTSRSSFLYKYFTGTLIPFDNTTPEWLKVFGREFPQVVEFNSKEQVKRFANIHTGKQDGKWMGTPFHNSFIHPLYELKEFNKTYDYLRDEYKYSPKIIGISNDIYEETSEKLDKSWRKNWLEDNDRFGYIKSIDTNEPISDFTTQIRFDPWYAKLKTDLQVICMSRGFNASALWLDIPPKEMTATESVQSNQETIQTIKRVQESIKSALKPLIYAWLLMLLRDKVITKEMIVSVDSADSIDIHLSDTFYQSREQKIELALRIQNAPTVDGSKLLPKKRIYEEFFGYGKETSALIEREAQEELWNAAIMQQRINMLTQPIQVEEQKEEKPTK